MPRHHWGGRTCADDMRQGHVLHHWLIHGGEGAISRLIRMMLSHRWP